MKKIQHFHRVTPVIAGNQCSAGAWSKAKVVSLSHMIPMKLSMKEEKQDRMNMGQVPINTDFCKNTQLDSQGSLP